MNTFPRLSFLTLPLAYALVACGGVEAEPPTEASAEAVTAEYTPLEKLPELSPDGSDHLRSALSTSATPIGTHIRQTGPGLCLTVSGTYAYYTTCTKGLTAQTFAFSQHPANVGTPNTWVGIVMSAVNINGAGPYKYCLESPEMNSNHGYLRLKPCAANFSNGYQFWERTTFYTWNSDISAYDWNNLMINNYSKGMLRKNSNDSWAWLGSVSHTRFNDHPVYTP